MVAYLIALVVFTAMARFSSGMADSTKTLVRRPDATPLRDYIGPAWGFFELSNKLFGFLLLGTLYGIPGAWVFSIGPFSESGGSTLILSVLSVIAIAVVLVTLLGCLVVRNIPPRDALVDGLERQVGKVYRTAFAFVGILMLMLLTVGFGMGAIATQQG